jgi:hypothetical protein
LLRFVSGEPYQGVSFDALLFSREGKHHRCLLLPIKQMRDKMSKQISNIINRIRLLRHRQRQRRLAKEMRAMYLKALYMDRKREEDKKKTKPSVFFNKKRAAIDVALICTHSLNILP